MSVREEDREKNGSASSRGLVWGLAATAIGVGVGAALYYFSKKENPSTSDDWPPNHFFRQRAWSLEECSICFEVILKEHEVMSLPCTHQFHTKCILPWLEQKQTCPNCRKSVD